MSYTVNDERGKDKPQEVCRCCGSQTVHTQEYNKPTMPCIEYLRGTIKDLKEMSGIDEDDVIEISPA